MPQEVWDASKLAIIASEPGASRQAFHWDALRKAGNSGLTSVGCYQYVEVIWNGYRATRIYEELIPDRQAATAYARERLGAANPAVTFSDSEWDEEVEPRIWHFLVHREFEARRLPPFELVRVPVPKDTTLILDSRCPHAGAPSTNKNRAYRWHYYAFANGLLTDPSQADEYITHFFGCQEYYPILGWAQRSELFK